MNPKLQNAVAIFKSLGWEGVTPENVMSLPLGTTEQKRAALSGLKSGEWAGYDYTGSNGVYIAQGYRRYVDVDTDKLALFAVRVGVDARRLIEIWHGPSNEMLVSVIAGRGVKYASDFIRLASGSYLGHVAVWLVDKLNFNVPQNVGYIENWAWCATAAMGLTDIHRDLSQLSGWDFIEKRFVEHVSVGVAVNTPPTGYFGEILPAGVKRSWMSRDQAVELAFAALDTSVRPRDRKIWLDILEELGVRDEELCARTQALIPLLALGDTAVVTRLAPALIAGAGGDLLTEVLLASFSADTKKARQTALKCALNRPRPENAEELTPWLAILAGDSDKTVAALSARLIRQWGITVDLLPEEKEIQGLWRETPPVWRLPPFEPGEVSPEALTELAAQLVNQAAVVRDVTAERFLAVANAVAHQDPRTARMSLRGLRGQSTLLHYAMSWVDEKPPYSADPNGERVISNPLVARDSIVFRHLDKLPCLLSTPSFVDLSVSVPDLAARLARYRQTGADAREADLFLALIRLDVSTKTPEAVETLRGLDVPVVSQSGEPMSVTAGQTALAYLDDPVKEPSMTVDKIGRWISTDVPVPDCLAGFPNRFYRQMHSFRIFPHWGDPAFFREVRWDGERAHPETGLIMRQAARRAAPLPPGASVNFLAALRTLAPGAAEDALRAVTEAWERGLLRPGAADVGMLDWTTMPPASLAALAAALDGVARDGLLSVVWPVLDALVAASLKEPRLLAGTAELAELAVEFLPEAQIAVERGVADPDVLFLPGIRALAQRGGASRAVTAARKIAALLPPLPAQAAPPIEDHSAPVMDPPFDQVWPAREDEAPFFDDGVTVSVDWAGSTEKMFLLFTLTLPEVTDRVFQVMKDGWTYDLEQEGQCLAYAAAPGATALAREREYINKGSTGYRHSAYPGSSFGSNKQQNEVWLRWEPEQEVMVISDWRNWPKGDNYPLTKDVKRPPLPFSLLTVAIGLLAQDAGDATYQAPNLLRQFIKNGQLDEKIICKSIQALIRYPAVNPAKLVRVLEKGIQLLPVLWPMLTECTKFAGKLVEENPPVWVNRILDVALRYAPYLAEAAKRGLIPAQDAQWAGLSEIAASKSKSIAVAKAKKLAAALGVS